MGTNYYYYKEPICKTCLREYDRIHIGKSSYGWCFSLHVYPPDINNLNDWLELFNVSESYIRDEYSNIMSKEEMIDVITNRKHGTKIDLTYEYLLRNSAVKGPNNLLRHKIDYVNCTGHGEGTFDYLIGNFS